MISLNSLTRQNNLTSELKHTQSISGKTKQNKRQLSPNMSISVRLSSPSPLFRKQHKRFLNISSHVQPLPSIPLLHASKRISIVSSKEGRDLVGEKRNWTRGLTSVYGVEDVGEVDDGDYGDDDEEDEEDRSLDLFVKFVHNMFKKVSKRTRKAARSVLPASISTSLVRFSVDGVLVLAFLWVLKGFLEVVCTLGSAVFVSILFIRVIWSGLIFLQQSRIQRLNEFDEYNAWTGARPVT